MSFRMMCQVVFGALVAATACGGTVKGEGDIPTEHLRADSAELCKSACATIARCGGDTDSCSCGCACPAGSADCVCPPCDCGSDTQTPAQCESGCTGSVQEVIDDNLGCDKPMLALLDCLASEPCKDGGAPCKAESEALKNCEKAKHSSPPPAGDSPAAGGPGPAVVTCHSATGGDSASVASPGDVSCQTGWDSCSDGNSYSVECRVTAGTALECDCSVNGTVQQSFSAASCPESSDDANKLCGWELG